MAHHPSSRCSDDSRMYSDTLWVNPCERMIERLSDSDINYSQAIADIKAIISNQRTEI